MRTNYDRSTSVLTKKKIGSRFESGDVSHEVVTRVDIKKSGNTNEPYWYIFLGGVTCVGIVWPVWEDTGGPNDFKTKRLAWYTSNTSEVFPTFDQAVDFALRNISAAIDNDYLKEEIAYVKKNNRIPGA